MSSTREVPLRSLGLTVSTTNCVGLRSEAYKYRLGLVYDYLIEYPPKNGTEETGPNLVGIENAVAYFVASTFSECDEQKSPLYAVALLSKHAVFEQGFCAPVEPLNECLVIRGYTEIRLDNIDPKIELKAFRAIDNALFLNQLDYDRVYFVRAVDATVEPNHYEEEQSSASIVAIAVAILSFALAAIFLTGLWRKNQVKKRKKKKEAEAPGSKKRFLLGSAPRKYYELDEEQGNGSGFKVVIMEQLEVPSSTWSDITDSASILSNLSKTTSKLQSIQEEENESNHTDEEWNGDNSFTDHLQVADSLPPEYLYGLSTSPRHHVDQWDVDALEEGTEPEGCRYLEDDSSEGEDPSTCSTSDDGPFTEVDITPDETTKDTLPSDTPSDAIESELNTSEATIESSNVIMHQSLADLVDEGEGEAVQQWLVELVNALRSAQSRKLLTFSEE